VKSLYLPLTAIPVCACCMRVVYALAMKSKSPLEYLRIGWMCSATSVPSSAFDRTTHFVCYVFMTDEALRNLQPRFNKLYAKTGRPSIAPEKLLPALLLQALTPCAANGC
jgi:hypothetical protein